MLTFRTKGDVLVCECDPEDVPCTPLRVKEALADSIDVDFVRNENEGAPVFLGNSYAQYEVWLTLPRFDGKPHRYGIGPMETDELDRTGRFETPALE